MTGALPDFPPDLADLWERYHREIRRWNSQINLVSRACGEEDLLRLTRECWDAAQALPAILSRVCPGLPGPWGTSQTDRAGQQVPGAGSSTGTYTGTDTGTSTMQVERCVYYDIGSGAGFPGVVWHVWLEQRLVHWQESNQERTSTGSRPHLQTHLVEPRQKRAWFLQRVLQVLDLHRVKVWSGRWGEKGETRREGPSGGGTLWLISLKALALTDTEVIAGWRRIIGASCMGDRDRLVICRFRSPGFRPEDDLIQRLALPPELPGLSPGEVGPPSAHVMVDCGPPAGSTAGLLVSSYSSLAAAVKPHHS